MIKEPIAIFGAWDNNNWKEEYPGARRPNINGRKFRAVFLFHNETYYTTVMPDELNLPRFTFDNNPNLTLEQMQKEVDEFLIANGCALIDDEDEWQKLVMLQ